MVMVLPELISTLFTNAIDVVYAINRLNGIREARQQPSVGHQALAHGGKGSWMVITMVTDHTYCAAAYT